MGRDSGFATSGGSGIKSFFMAGNGISHHQRDRDLDYFAFFWRDSICHPFHPSIWLFRLANPKPQFIHTNRRNRIQTHTLTQILSFHLSILGKFLPFNRLSIIGRILHLHQTSLLCCLFSSIINFSSLYHTYFVCSIFCPSRYTFIFT